jgi:hypothetical protein
MNTEKVIKKDEGSGNIVILDEGINKDGIEPASICCWFVYFPWRL